MSLLFCLCVFCDSFLCSISLFLLSDSLSSVLNSECAVNVIVHGMYGTRQNECNKHAAVALISTAYHTPCLSPRVRRTF